MTSSNPEKEQALKGVTSKLASVYTEIEPSTAKNYHPNEFGVTKPNNSVLNFNPAAPGSDVTGDYPITDPGVEEVNITLKASSFMSEIVSKMADEMTHAILHGNHPSVTIDSIPQSSTEADMAMNFNKLKQQLAAGKTPADAFGKFPDNPKAPEVVPMMKATKLYQPVKGTLNVYVTVAISDDLVVSARAEGKGLSVRYDGPGLKSCAPALEAAGFTAKPGGHHSVHVILENDGPMKNNMGQRTLMSMIGASMHEFKTPNPLYEKVLKCCQSSNYGL